MYGVRASARFRRFRVIRAIDARGRIRGAKRNVLLFSDYARNLMRFCANYRYVCGYRLWIVGLRKRKLD